MSVQIKVTIPKLASFRAALSKYPQITAKNINIAIRQSIEQIDRSASPLTPVDTGALVRSLGQNKQYGPLSGSIGSNLDYAVKQHENLSYHHTVGGPKFLERGVQQSMGNIKEYFENALEKTHEEIKRRT